VRRLAIAATLLLLAVFWAFHAATAPAPLPMPPPLVADLPPASPPAGMAIYQLR
jgi:hypothetical protein